MDPFAILELVEEGIERGDVERQQPARLARDLARDVIAVELAVFERRQDQDFGAALSRRRLNDWVSPYVGLIYIKSVQGFKGLAFKGAVQAFKRFEFL